jgi:hypothetical protein
MRALLGASTVSAKPDNVHPASTSPPTNERNIMSPLVAPRRNYGAGAIVSLNEE